MNRLKLLKVSEDTEVGWTFVNGPLQISIGSGNFDKTGRFISRNYWRLKEPNGRGLFSIDITKETGSLLGMELVIYKGKLHPLKRIEDHEVRRETGTPLFDLSLWRELQTQDGLDFSADKPALVYLHKDLEGPILYSVPANFLLQLGANELRIELFPQQIMHEVAVGKKLICEFNAASELCAVTLKDIDADSHAYIKNEYGDR